MTIFGIFILGAFGVQAELNAFRSLIRTCSYLNGGCWKVCQSCVKHFSSSGVCFEFFVVGMLRDICCGLIGIRNELGFVNN